MVGPFGTVISRIPTVSRVFEKVTKCLTFIGPAIVRKSLRTLAFFTFKFDAVNGDMTRRKSIIKSFRFLPVLPRQMTIEWGCFAMLKEAFMAACSKLPILPFLLDDLPRSLLPLRSRSIPRRHFFLVLLLWSKWDEEKFRMFDMFKYHQMAVASNSNSRIAGNLCGEVKKERNKVKDQ